MENKNNLIKNQHIFLEVGLSWFLRAGNQTQQEYFIPEASYFKATGGQNLQWPEDAWLICQLWTVKPYYQIYLGFPWWLRW